YRKDASLSDDFNDTMVERIKQFQQRNDLKETGVINATTLSKLYADDAKTGSFYGQTSTSSSESSSQSNSGSSSSKSGGHWEWQWQWVWRYLTCFNTSRDCPKCRGLGSYQDLVQEKMPVWVPD
ncbi:MAG: peptidoglycan-binding protein, partial [Firmicutes bacterium]|nr:peptidoglycan-binding protein [Bacillota bacterium]